MKLTQYTIYYFFDFGFLLILFIHIFYVCTYVYVLSLYMYACMYIYNFLTFIVADKTIKFSHIVKILNFALTAVISGLEKYS